MQYEFTIDKKALKRQIKAVLESNIPEEEKSGIHNMLGEIYDQTVRK